jgi:uncharacterized protein
MAILLTLLVPLYNNVINRWAPFHSWAYVPTNVGFASVLVLVATSPPSISWSEVAPIRRLDPLALAAVLLFGLVAFAIARSRRAHRIADKRVAELSGATLLFHLLVRIPLGTAAIEELLFRGALFSLWRDAELSLTGAAVASSVAFGLWHIAPSAIGLRMNEPDASSEKVRATILAAVAATFVAGLFLCWVRVETGGLLSPFVLHAGLNSLGAGAAVLAGRRTQDDAASKNRREF